MKEEKNYIRDLEEIRSMMERSSKFLTLSGWAGVFAGIFALIGAGIAYAVFEFNPDNILYEPVRDANIETNLPFVIILALIVLVFALIMAIYLSWKKANNKGEKLWNTTSKRLMVNLSLPLITGGIMILILLSKGLVGLIAPLSLIFYGIALFNAGDITYKEVRLLGITEIILGLISLNFIGYGLLIWALGFGVFHIIYGIFIYYRYEK